MDELDGDSLSHAKWEREYHVVRISKRQMMVPYTQLRQFLGAVPDSATLRIRRNGRITDRLMCDTALKFLGNGG